MSETIQYTMPHPNSLRFNTGLLISFPTIPILALEGLRGTEGIGLFGEGGMSLFPIAHGSTPGEPTSIRI
jgi:hypothetical protein